MDIIKNFGERLNGLIIESKLTVQSLGKAINCSPSSIYEWQSGKVAYMPSIANLLLLADYFQCSLDYLIGISEHGGTIMIKDRPPFSVWFRTAIEARGYNLYKLGKSTQMGTAQYYAWISGQTEPSIDSLLRISAVINCSLDYLVGRE